MKQSTKKVIALNFPPKNGQGKMNSVSGSNIFTDLCGDINQEDAVYMTSKAYADVFGKSRKDSSRCRKRLSVVKIYSPITGKSIYRQYVFNLNFSGLTDDDIALNPASIRELCGPGFDNSDIVGSEIEVYKGCLFSYYWHHPFHATRISMKLGLISILLALVSIAISLLAIFM